MTRSASRTVGLLETVGFSNPILLLDCWPLKGPANSPIVMWSDRQHLSEMVLVGDAVSSIATGHRDLSACDESLQDGEDRGAVALNIGGDLPSRSPAWMIGQRGEDGRIERRNSLNPSAALACPLTLSDSSSTVVLLADVARGARGHQVGEIVGSPLADSQDVIDVQDDVRRELSAVAAGEIVSLKDGPSDGVPVSRDSACCTHVGSIPNTQQGTRLYRSVEPVE